MIPCPICLTIHKDQEAFCRSCGRSLTGIGDQENRDNIMRWRERNRRRSHMITGAILCFGLPTLLGLPLSLLPLVLLENLLFGIVFGVPLGWLVSRFADSAWSGALIGCGVGVVYVIVTGVILGTGTSLMSGLALGLLPGAIMGFHVEQDR